MSKRMLDWPTEAEAAQILGTSVKTITRYGAKGLIEIRKRPREGKRPENVCNPRDVEKLKPAAHVMPAASQALVPAVRETALAPLVPEFVSFIRTISTAIATMRTDVQNGTIEKLWLNLDEAAAYSGLAKRDLLELCRMEDPPIDVRKSGGWKIRRASLERFEG